MCEIGLETRLREDAGPSRLRRSAKKARKCKTRQHTGTLNNELNDPFTQSSSCHLRSDAPVRTKSSNWRVHESNPRILDQPQATNQSSRLETRDRAQSQSANTHPKREESTHGLSWSSQLPAMTDLRDTPTMGPCITPSVHRLTMKASTLKTPVRLSRRVTLRFSHLSS